MDRFSAQTQDSAVARSGQTQSQPPRSGETQSQWLWLLVALAGIAVLTAALVLASRLQARRRPELLADARLSAPQAAVGSQLRITGSGSNIALFRKIVRGPPGELFPPDVDEAGLPVELDAVDEDPGEPFFDELPADEWAA